VVDGVDYRHVRVQTAQTVGCASAQAGADRPCSYGNLIRERLSSEDPSTLGVPYDPSGRDFRTGALCGTPLELVGACRRRPWRGELPPVARTPCVLTSRLDDTPWSIRHQGLPTPVPFMPAHRMQDRQTAALRLLSVRRPLMWRGQYADWRPSSLRREGTRTPEKREYLVPREP
jgi:hypothetical protein